MTTTMALPDTSPTWLTAQVRPAGSFGRSDVGRLRALLDALSSCASLVVLDLQAMQLRSSAAAEVIDAAAADLESRGGCLLCINADLQARHALCDCVHAVVVPSGELVTV
ncbi:MAG: hypothetical protein L6311_16615 [Cellulomonas sp.]|nr:hypothetical protein [Cellulomonas sp.]